jgi:hypothetical protein
VAASSISYLCQDLDTGWRRQEGQASDIEGGTAPQMPRGVMLHQRRENRKTVVSFGVHALQPIFDFYARVRSVRVKMRSTSDETHKFLLNRSEL